ncbi:MAG: rRNA maturation RNase YbeY [Clostridia bacterium]|nr:rRNA maturation RNase YbeY [Clostridia bacterium]
MLKIYCEDKIELPRINDVAAAVASELCQRADLYAELQFVSSKRIRVINRENRGVDAVTDVLSFPMLENVKGVKITKSAFPFDYDPDKKAVFIGSVVISLSRAKSQAKKYGHSEEREIYYLIVHSLLHLFGFDHVTETDKREMRAAEEKIMTKLGVLR